MASLTADQSQKVRVVAKIRDFKDEEYESLSGNPAPWISVRKPCDEDSSKSVTISFGDQSTRNVYEVDNCYDQSEDISVIYSREIKPLIPRVFDGQNVTIIAYGARGSGKTYTMQGNEEKQGLAELATAEILSEADVNGMSVSISLFEVFQEHVYDLLDPKHPEVQVLEDAQGKIKLKGLSEGIVKSVSEFHKSYILGCRANRRSHKGLILQISSNNGSTNFKIVGKMNFVDLAGYEDARRKSCEGVVLIESSRINKSLYGLLNVVYALNANEPRVPFRESKLTRILQDSFGGTNRVLLLTCLNPFLCQDTIYTTSLASRSCQAVNRIKANSALKCKTLCKPNVLSSLTKGKLNTASSTKKQNSSTPFISARKTSRVAKERKVVEEGKDVTPLKQAKSPSASAMQSRFLSETNSDIAISFQEEEESMLEIIPITAPRDEENSISDALMDTKPEGKKDAAFYGESNNSELTPSMDGNIKALILHEEVGNKEKENKPFLVNDVGSPPLSARLREISNNLKSLYSTTPIQIKLPHEIATPCRGKVVCSDIVEPKTPVEQDKRVEDKWDLARYNSPWKKFNARSSELKHSLADEYLKFLNTADKEELKKLRGIGEKRATYILELREESPEPFKNLEDLKDIGLSAKQIKGVMKSVAGNLFN